jgi:hypothetical protein
MPESSQRESRAAKAAAQAEEQPQAEAQAAPQAETVEATGESGPPTELPVGDLIANSDALIGYPVHATSVALSDRPADEVINVDLAKSLVDAWMDTPVQVDPAQEQEG